METILTYNVKATRNVNISYIKINKEINNIKIQKYCRKFVPGLTNMPTNSE